MSHKTVGSRSLHGALVGAMLAGFSGGAWALEFMIAEQPLRIENLFTVGGMWRAQDVDPTLIGKSTLFAYNNGSTREGLCLERTSGSPDSNPSSFTTLTPTRPNSYNAPTAVPGNPPPPGTAAIGRGCTTSAPSGQPSTTASPENITYVGAPGSFSPNGDNGDLNFAKGDLVHAVAKLLTDVNYSIFDYNFFVRGVAFFDYNYHEKLQETHYDTTMQGRYSQLPESVDRTIGVDYDLLDYNISHIFTIGPKDIAVKIGDQVLNWGESSLLALNSLNTINPPDARRLNTPGLDLKEAFRPIGMVTASTDLFENFSLDAFYGYEWKPIVVDPVGTFFSQSDTLGPGGDYAMLSFAKAPEDPGFVIANPTAEELISYPTGKRGYYRPIDSCGAPGTPQQASCTDSIGLLGSTASRTIYRDHRAEKENEPDGGDYGAVLKMFLEQINNGTELALYYANYDSRLPVVSGFAARDSCIGDDGSASAATFASDCAYAGPGAPAGNEPIPVDTARLMVEYPEDIKLYGLSFNTTVGDFALSGEYAFRENLPIQIDSVDLTYTLLQPAFPDQDVNLGAVTIPGRQSAFATFLPQYRGMSCEPGGPCITAGQYVPGYERFKVGQTNLTILRLIGGDNPIAASQMTFLLEMGMQKVFDMPALSELQLEGTGSDTHISSGADGSVGIDPPGVTGNSSGNQRRNNGLIQNPTAHKDYLGYGTSESYGYRLLNLNRWESALFGMINLETLTIIRHDVKGTTPGIATNFSDGRKQFNFGLRGDYLSKYIAEVRYTWFTGGGKRDGQRDRDNVFVTFGYQF